MARRQLVIEIPALGAIDRSLGGIGLQLADALRSAIAKGALKPGERLPSTRALADSLGLSRGTVAEAYEQLMAEGCLEAQAGSSTRVAAGLREAHTAPQRHLGKQAGQPPSPPVSASRYAVLADRLAPLPSAPFSVAVPEGDIAMDDHWRRLSNRVRASQVAAPSGYADPQGLLALREAIADYLRRARAVNCDPENIVITEGTQQGLYLASKVLLAPGDAAWAEDPAYSGLTSVLEDCGVRVHRIPVDTQGLNVANAMNAYPDARAAFVTPSHQYPLGMPLSMPRRLALVDWARQHDGWLVEDDYDSELRYAGQPFPAMQGLDRDRVVYLGTFSKVLAPSLRLGYIVAPDCLVKALVGARALMGRGSPSTEQHVIAAYMREGYFETHIRRIRAIYAERRQVLMGALQAELPELRIQPADQGMHIVVWLPEGLDDVVVASAASRVGIALRALSPMCSGHLQLSGLMLGFGGFTVEQIWDAVKGLRRVLEAMP
ncbi:PLP-dependent aminotransferase family protein [Comamonas testosteroni]|uniref:MocR-like pyridoxine biosynthesis transcription factor PdxR n=1 Tax=Comamonas testosteroni TaxID=285 RepID=UPI003918763B